MTRIHIDDITAFQEAQCVIPGCETTPDVIIVPNHDTYVYPCCDEHISIVAAEHMPCRYVKMDAPDQTAIDPRD